MSDCDPVQLSFPECFAARADEKDYCQAAPLPVAGQISRREFVATVGIVTGALAFGVPSNSAGITLDELVSGMSAGAFPLQLRINGEQRGFTVDPRVTLLDLLREYFGLTGTKKGCDHGQCGACTVLANGRRINSCLSLALVHDGDEIVTIEGLAKGKELHPVQSAFLAHDGYQCGYCTPGQICSAVALLEEYRRGDASFVTKDLGYLKPPQLTPEEIRERMSGNICRCGAYPGIVAALQSIAAPEPAKTK